MKKIQIGLVAVVLVFTCMTYTAKAQQSSVQLSDMKSDFFLEAMSTDLGTISLMLNVHATSMDKIRLYEVTIEATNSSNPKVYQYTISKQDSTYVISGLPGVGTSMIKKDNIEIMIRLDSVLRTYMKKISVVAKEENGLASNILSKEF